MKFYAAIMLCFALLNSACSVDRGQVEQAVRLSEAPKISVTPGTARPVPEIAFDLRIDAQWPVSYEAIEPAYPSLITEMIVRDYARSIRTQGDTRFLSTTLSVEATIEGVYRVPPIAITLVPKGEGTIERIKTFPLFLEIGLPAAKDAVDIRDIKPLLRKPVQGRPYIIAAAAGLFTTLLAFALFSWWRRRGAKGLPPLEQFEQDVSAIFGDQFGKEQAFVLSMALRGYVENRSTIRAKEMTIRELQKAFQGTSELVLQDRAWQNLLDMCVQLDMLKYNPSRSSTEGGKSSAEWIQQAKTILQHTEAVYAVDQGKEDT